MRRHYLDNLRWAVVVLVLLYHVCYLFNGVGIPGGLPGSESIPALDGAMYIVYPWFMALLFLIAGMSARYALERRTPRQFLRERAGKLLIPSTLGLFVIHWVTGLLNLRAGGALPYIPAPLLYPIAALSGIGPLWFIQMLFLFSCLLVFLRRLDRDDRLWKLDGRVSAPALPLLFLPLWGAAQVGNVPVLTMYRFGIYLTAFLMGYYIFSHDEVRDAAVRLRVPMLAAAAAAGTVYMVRFYGTDFTAPQCLQSFWTNLYLWAVILALLGWGKVLWDRETPFTRFMTRCSFGLYVLHYPVLMAVCSLLRYALALPPVWNYAAAAVLGAAGTFALCALVRRLPLIRFLVLGIRKENRRPVP
ncbi:MAG: acyltransferase [Clostridiales bacterium]|nr:acyltransferase [Clostridiales bacterium]